MVVKECFPRDEDPVLAKNRIRGSIPQTNGGFEMFLNQIFLDIIKSLLFVFILSVSDVL